MKDGTSQNLYSARRNVKSIFLDGRSHIVWLCPRPISASAATFYIPHVTNAALFGTEDRTAEISGLWGPVEEIKQKIADILGIDVSRLSSD